jgi:hypothetical protein
MATLSPSSVSINHQTLQRDYPNLCGEAGFAVAGGGEGAGAVCGGGTGSTGRDVGDDVISSSPISKVGVPLGSFRRPSAR